jgi:Holliday junction resolvase RusA-like endonuclease
MIQFVVYGKPQPQGSTRTFIPQRKACPKCEQSFVYKDEKTGKNQVKLEVECPKCHAFLRPILTSDNAELSTWRQEVTQAALEAVKGPHDPEDLPFPKGIAVAMRLSFYLLRPASAPKRVTHPVTRPDAGKLARAIEDALTGVVYRDDGQIVLRTVEKDFGAPQRVEVAVWAHGNPGTPLGSSRARTLELFGAGK